MIASRRIYAKLPRPLQWLAVQAYGSWQARQRFGGDFRTLVAGLEESQWKSPEETAATQCVALKALVTHAYQTVPYYRAIFDRAALIPSDIQTLDNLKALPLLTKAEINRNFHELVSCAVSKRDVVLHHTSGTTGERLRGFYLPKWLRWRMNVATLYRFYRWAGYDVGQRRVTIAGRHFVNKSPFFMINRAEKQLLLSTHHISNSTIDDYLSAVKKFSPTAIQGHPSAIATLARRMKELDTFISADCVLTTGEQLYPEDRQDIEERFQCRVFDAWGHGESAGMAGECELHAGYHIASEYGIVEVIETEELRGTGWGEIVVTSLHNLAMPFIRYQTGDLAILSHVACACGRGLPLLKSIMGRIDDAIWLPDGRAVLPVTIRKALRDVPLLAEYQVRQTTKRRVTLLARWELGVGEKQHRDLVDQLAKVIPGLDVEISQVNTIPQTGVKKRLVMGLSTSRAKGGERTNASR